ncbi:MAG: Gar1/Naf1 family protein [Nitrososphaerales archaeon]
MVEKVGLVLHLAKSGRLIVKATTSNIKVGAIIIDANGRKVAKVAEVFGQVKAPYLSCIPLSDRVKKLEGKEVYTSTEGDKSG